MRNGRRAVVLVAPEAIDYAISDLYVRVRSSTFFRFISEV